MKTYVTLCLILILLSATNTFAQSAKKTRRSNPQASVSISPDFSKFVGVWEFISDPSNGTGIFGKGYFKVTEQQAQKFKFIEGTEYQGNVTWTEATVKNADGIYLKPLNGKLTGRFTSPDFRASHGYDLTYRVTLFLEPKGKLLYSVCIGLDCEKYYATKINDGEDINEEQKTAWTEIDRGKKTDKFQFSPNRILLYDGRPITGIRFNSTVQKIAISPTSASAKYAICVAFDDMNSAGYLLRLDSHSGKRLALQGPPSVWAAWSPAGTHAVIGSYYEADETLYSISLPSGIVRRFSFQLARQNEEESFDLDNLTWIDNRVFRLRVKIHCNPYTVDNCSDQDREKILREYEVKANVATLAVSPERLR